MNTKPQDQVLLPECTGCTKAGRTTCKVIEHPAVWWKTGECTARSEDPDWEQKAAEAGRLYVLNRPERKVKE